MIANGVSNMRLFHHVVRFEPPSQELADRANHRAQDDRRQVHIEQNQRWMIFMNVFESIETIKKLLNFFIPLI